MPRPKKEPNPAGQKKRNLFDFLNAIYLDQSVGYFDSLTEEEKKGYTNYMVNRFISMNWDFVDVVNEFQQFYGEVGPRESYLFYSQILPRGKQFNKYIKPRVGTEYADWLVGLIRNHYVVSVREAESYLELFLASRDGKQKLRELLELYGTELKKIRSVLGG